MIKKYLKLVLLELKKIVSHFNICTKQLFRKYQNLNKESN